MYNLMNMHMLFVADKDELNLTLCELMAGPVHWDCYLTNQWRKEFASFSFQRRSFLHISSSTNYIQCGVCCSFSSIFFFFDKNWIRFSVIIFLSTQAHEILLLFKSVRGFIQVT